MGTPLVRIEIDVVDQGIHCSSPMRFPSDLLAGRLGLPAPVRLVQIKVRIGESMGRWDDGMMG